MNTRLSASLFVLGTLLMLILSFSFGFHSYTEAKKMIVTDLNQVLQQTILQNSHQWMSQDSIRTCANLSKHSGNPVSIESYSEDFSDALGYTPDKKKTGTVVHVLNKDLQTENAPANINEKLNEYYIASDTTIWASSTANNPNATAGHIGISFRGYISCSALVVIRLSDKSLPGLFLGLAFLSATLPLLSKRYREELIMPQPIHPGKIISFGNLNLFCEIASLYKENEEKLKLTSQQYALMEMFLLSPTYILNRSDICESLRLGKISADETLNTLIRRLQPLVGEGSNLKTTTDRRRAYVLEIKRSGHL